MFEFDLSDEFRKILKKLSKKSPVIAKAINRKIREIISMDKEAVLSYKNLRYGLRNIKRVHITDWLVITFEVQLENNFILFVKIESRDKVYKR